MLVSLKELVMINCELELEGELFITVVIYNNKILQIKPIYIPRTYLFPRLPGDDILETSEMVYFVGQ